MMKNLRPFLADCCNSKLKRKNKKNAPLSTSVKGPAIEINNLTAIRVKEEFLRKIVKIVFKKEKQKEKKLSIALVGQKKIRELNKKYRRENRATDVLAFSGNGLEEIVLCPWKVERNAERFESTFKKELTRVLIHGILHLLGYDHEKNITGAKKMSKKEKYYLSHLKF
ncbi:MAG TPA: rRNA maturation RNase YbeY [Candidatus Humimicrobiaceae bacterium]|nr:rRNA maturation RNase YbeY [Candidatus Humimicrobiaceae bacterium]